MRHALCLPSARLLQAGALRFGENYGPLNHNSNV